MPKTRIRLGLRVLRAFDKKIHDFATQSMPADSGLDTINNRASASRLRHEIAALHEGWTSDEALHKLIQSHTGVAT